MKILVTGAAGFIGMHLAARLLARGDEVIGTDNLNSYYSTQLKRDRLAQLQGYPKFHFEWLDLADRPGMAALFEQHRFDRVVHLAAQAGVRYSLENPQAYADSNLVGFLNVLEGCRHTNVQHLVYASSSSVYGGNRQMPFSEAHNVDHPVSLYAATKKANELMAHSYSHLYRIPTTGLRFFTVYGPWGRPDMAAFLFTEAILAGRAIKVFNHGHMARDFTYVDDVVGGVVASLDRAPEGAAGFEPSLPDPGSSTAPYRIFNIGNQSPVPLMDFIRALEAALGKQALLEFLPMQPGDVPETHADTSRLASWTGLQPKTGVAEGVAKFVAWYRSYYH